ncbi:MAG: hypothetical protein R2795_13660 [Saprospiraceae bacterium]
MKYFIKLTFLFPISLLVLSLFSCQLDSNNDGLDPTISAQVPWDEYMNTKLAEAGWELSYSDEKRKYCQLGDGEPFECDGDCYIRHDEAHAACVGCTTNDIEACTGSLGGVIFIILSQMAVDYPTVDIDYTLYDDNGNIINSIEGDIGVKMPEINSANEDMSAAKFKLKLSSN